MAFQLGGQEGYDIIGEAVRQGTAPGGRQLDALLEHVGPCVVLMDELVSYVRNAGAAQDSIYTFIQALTQSVRRSKDAVLVITLPQSRVEAGAEGGADALDRLDSLLGRIEAVWEPLAVNETFEVVRRRLFGEIADPAARDRTCEAFVRMYSHDRAEYPQGVTERNYLERMKACYPIHPEIFDRLYSPDHAGQPAFERRKAG
jgi:predicted AAA+ superfamily ATPase